MAMSLSVLLLAALPALRVAAQNVSVLVDCLSSSEVPIVLSSDSEWAEEISPFNLRFSYNPAVVATPTVLEEVEAAVSCAAQNDIKVNARSGGHSYGAFGLGGEDGHLIIDLAALNEVTLDSYTNIATVGAGSRLGPMAQAIFDQGKRGMPHGTCPGVGIGGHALFGGFGLSSRLWGLALDQIVAMTTVLANGTSLVVTEDSDPDLFWALRGAGPSYGIVTEFQMKTFAAPEENIFWSYAWNVNNDAAKSAELLSTLLAWGDENAPPELGYGATINPGGSVAIRGVWYGDEASYNATIAPVLEEVAKLDVGEPTVTFENDDYITSLILLAGAPSTNLTSGWGEHDTFYAKSIVEREGTALSNDALEGLFTYLYSTADDAPPYFLILNLYGGPGSVINAVPASTDPDATSSYGHRDSSYVWQLYANTATNNPPWDPTIIDYVDGMVGALGPEAANLSAYVPYVDPELEPADARVRYWGEGVDRLQSLKKVYDPNDVFEWPQGFN